MFAKTDIVRITEPDANLGDRMAGAAWEEEKQSGRNEGNRAVARVAPLALGYLGAGREAALAAAADKLASLTQAAHEARDAAVLLALGVRSGILTGDPDVQAQVQHLPAARRDAWTRRLAAAEKAAPETFKAASSTAAGALQAAVAVTAAANGLKDALDRAVRIGGGECGRVACITGALAGAKFGGDDTHDWTNKLYGWQHRGLELQFEVVELINDKYS